MFYFITKKKEKKEKKKELGKDIFWWEMYHIWVTEISKIGWWVYNVLFLQCIGTFILSNMGVTDIGKIGCKQQHFIYYGCLVQIG